ncbi:MAG: hypothetical protein E6J91_11225 [Deltaproteobacteria bacterium]|nr:MAG: hypothetical protein E6J91_11225 [Deltaproteobacteria bacterium]
MQPRARRGGVAVADPRLRADQAARAGAAVPVQVRQPGERAAGRAAGARRAGRRRRARRARGRPGPRLLPRIRGRARRARGCAAVSHCRSRARERGVSDQRAVISVQCRRR